MDSDKWQRAKELFGSALDHDPAQRRAFLTQACGGDEALRQEIEGLLAAHEEAGTTIADPRGRDSLSGRRLGSYQLMHRIGQGGMAMVYLAARADDQFRKCVAIKLILHGLHTEDLLRRFRNERQTLAALDHPNIVKLLDSGETEDHLPYLVMDYVEGSPITDYCDTRRLSTAERLLLFRQVCSAISYAHLRLVIHRDLKPGNILVTADGTPKVLDFGIAKLLNPEAAATVVVTRTGQRLMTPDYASPEQVRGEPLTNTTDVYALGVVLYELLTGHRPYRLKNQSFLEIERAVCQEEPLRPSTAVTRMHERTTANGLSIVVTPELVSRTRESDPKRLFSKLHGDLDAIVMMALRKEPQRRYPSVYEFSEDIRRHLDGSPVQARPSTILYRGTKFLLRHKDAAVAVGVLLVFIGALAIGGFLYLRHAQAPVASAILRKETPSLSTTSTSSPAAKYGWHESELPAEVSMPDLSTVGGTYASQQLVLFGAGSLRVWDPEQSGPPPLPIGFTIAGRADCAAGMWLVHDDHRQLTNWDMTKQRALKNITLPWRFLSAACLDDQGERWMFRLADPQSSRLVEFDASTNRTLQTTRLDASYFDLALDDQRRNLVLVREDRISVRTRDPLVELFRDSPSETLFHVVHSWSPSGRYIALGFKQLLIYDVEQKRRINTLPTMSWINGVGWIGDNGISAMDDRGRLYWTSDLSKAWELKQEPPAESVYREFWDPTNLRWLAADRNGRLFASTYVTPSLLFDIPVSTLETWSIASDPRGSTVAVSGKDSRIQMVDLKQQKVVRTLEGHTDGVTFVRFDPAHRLISASDDATIRIWDPDAGKLLETVPAHRSLINAFAISPDGKWLVSVSSDKTIKLWELPGVIWKKDIATTENSGAAIAFLVGDSKSFLVSDWSGWLYLYQGEAPDWKLRQKFRLGTKEVYMVCPSRTGWWAALPSGDKAGLWTVPESGIERVPSYRRRQRGIARPPMTGG